MTDCNNWWLMDMPDVQPLVLNAYIIQKKLGFCSLTF